jgi:hypothetical protein
VGSKDLDRDNAIEPRVPRAIDFAHTARAQKGEDLIRSEGTADDERHAQGEDTP